MKNWNLWSSDIGRKSKSGARVKAEGEAVAVEIPFVTAIPVPAGDREKIHEAIQQEFQKFGWPSFAEEGYKPSCRQCRANRVIIFAR